MSARFLLADVKDIIGGVTPPPGIKDWMAIPNAGEGAPGLIPFFNALLKLLIVVAGLYALLNLVLAGFQFISAGGDPKNVEKAWSKIWQSLVGLLIVAASFLLAALFGWILFKDPGAILNPKIYGPQ